MASTPATNGKAKAAATPTTTPSGTTTKYPIASWDVQYIIQHNEGPFLFQQSPWKLLSKDVRFTLRTAYEIPAIFLPLSDTRGDIRFLGIIAQVLMLAISLVLSILIVIGAIGGIPFLLIGSVIATVVFVEVGSALQGATTRQSVAPGVPDAPNADKEKWLL